MIVTETQIAIQRSSSWATNYTDTDTDIWVLVFQTALNCSIMSWSAQNWSELVRKWSGNGIEGRQVHLPPLKADSNYSEGWVVVELIA